MSANPPTQPDGSGRDSVRTLLSVDLWTGRRLAWAALVVTGIAYLIFRGAPALGWALSRIREVLVTVVLAVVVAYLVCPLVDAFCTVPFLARWRGGRVTAALATFILLGVGLVCLAVLTADPIIHETVRLSRLSSDWLEEAPHRLEHWLQAYSATVPPSVADAINRRASELATTVVDWAGLFAVGIVTRGWYLIEALLVPVLAFYFVTDSDRLLQGVLGAVPQEHHGRVRLLARDIDHTLLAYVRGQLILCLVAAIVISVTLRALDVRVFLTLGILAGLSRAVPVLGPIVAVIPIVIITFIQCGPEAALTALGIFVAIQSIESKLVMPKVIGHQAALHPVVVIIALLIGGEFLGILGMFVAVPIVAILRVAFVHWRAARQGVEAAA